MVELLRTMNSYYSNLIEGHNTHPLAIEKAMHGDYSADPALRALQLESRAHIEVQLLVEQRLEDAPGTDICAPDFLRWIHREFYQRLPDEFRTVKTASGGEDRVLPGELRQCEVEVGHHIPPTFASLPRFLARFAEGYSPDALDPLQRIVAVAASHHRLAWIHPFLDGNGRVTRLFTHAYFIRVKTDGHRLWMVSRGLARHRDEYMAALASGDAQRRNDLDGRGNLSNEGLARFCRFFLGTAIDQVEFMTSLLDLDSMQERILLIAERWIARTLGPRRFRTCCAMSFCAAKSPGAKRHASCRNPNAPRAASLVRCWRKACSRPTDRRRCPTRLARLTRRLLFSPAVSRRRGNGLIQTIADRRTAADHNKVPVLLA